MPRFLQKFIRNRKTDFDYPPEEVEEQRNHCSVEALRKAILTNVQSRFDQNSKFIGATHVASGL